MKKKLSDIQKSNAEERASEIRSKRAVRMGRAIQVDLAKAGGVYDRMAKLLSSAHILISQAGMMYDEVAEYAKKYRVDVGRLVKGRQDIERDLDYYHKEFATFMNSGSIMELAHDLDAFRAMYFKFCGLEEHWIPDKGKMLEAKKALEDKYGLDIRLGYDGMVSQITYKPQEEEKASN